MLLRRMALVACLLGASTIAGCAPMAFKITPVPVDRKLKEIELMRDSGWVSDKIALIDVSGVIVNGPSGGFLSEGEHPVAFLLEKLEAARRDKAVKAVVLRLNSPGGSVTASDMMYEELLRFRQSGKPVVAMMMDVAASGAYYMACACDEIMAHPTTVTGSIGVIMQSVNISGTLSKIGVSTDAIKSGPNKDAGSPFRAMSEDERAIFQEMIDQFYARFVDVVERGRSKLNREQVLKLADGRVYTARQALDSGLIDRMGSLRDALDRAKELAGIKKSRVVTYQRPLSWHPNIYAQAPWSAPSAGTVNVFNIELPSWLRPGGAKFMYLWNPR